MHHPDPGLIFAPGEQPDKVLFQKATNEITHGRYEVGRLTLQTLINTYPDSEYLSKAKLAIADSYYSEGGVSGLTQAEAEYKDFITFFPTAPEAPEAQFRVGMAHFRLMAKADRDQTEAKVADAEFKEFLLKYPDSPLIPRVKGRLRQTQEVLAQGEYFTANFYYMHGAYPAARSRFQEIIDKYPNFSGGDTALYYLGQSLEHLKRGREAVPYYSHVITDFPLSPLVPQAKAAVDRHESAHPAAHARHAGTRASGCKPSRGARLVEQAGWHDVKRSRYQHHTLRPCAYWRYFRQWNRDREGAADRRAVPPTPPSWPTPVNEKSLESGEARGGGHESQQRQRKGQGKYPRQDSARRCETRGACQKEGPLPRLEESR